jgi:phospholipid/cholesterol/gamma-HCH transport system permease protein
MSSEKNVAQLNVRRKNGVVLVELAGDWLKHGGLPALEPVEKELGADGKVTTLEFNTTALGRWNSYLMILILKIHELCRQHKVEFRAQTLPPGMARLIEISQSSAQKPPERDSEPGSLLNRVGKYGLNVWAGGKGMLTFLGENVLGFVKLLRGRAQFRWADMLLVMQQSGPQALGIVGLINFIVGLILAFVGATQLSRFGASIYVADQVAIATVREMGCMMTGNILSGRPGAASAAQLGTMKVNQELEAFQTFGISPIEFLVLPRMMALVIVMPFLCVFADVIAIAGGLLVSWGMMDITPELYLNRSLDAITLKSFMLGVVKGTYFGAVIALTGCLRGMQCGTNAAAVGLATTSAVVTGITAIIASDGVFAVICHVLGI